MSDEQAVTDGGRRCSVTIWTTAKSGPQWRVRLSEEADDELADLVVTRAVRAFRRVEAELTETPVAQPPPPFHGEGPKAPEEHAAA